MVVSLLEHAITITGFVLVMMLMVEYLNVITRGALQRRLQQTGGRLPAVLIGTVPGCFGAFTSVALYAHGTISLGALAGSMIAASGDEAFVMLALFPGRALILFGTLFVYGLIVAWVIDKVFGMRLYHPSNCASGLAVHDTEVALFHPFRAPLAGVSWSRDRVLLAGGLLAFAVALGLGVAAGDAPVWLRVVLVAVVVLLAALVIVAPEHFVREHLLRHIVREHGTRVFLWTFGALALTEWVTRSGLGLEAFIRDHAALAVLVAAAVGVVPESGPHLIFATLYAGGVLPFSVLLASSAVQDGHGMLPLLASPSAMRRCCWGSRVRRAGQSCRHADSQSRWKGECVMPGRDGTGPAGSGPGAGRGRGRCAPGSGLGPAGNAGRQGRGMGWGGQAGVQGRHGRRWRGSEPGQPGSPRPVAQPTGPARDDGPDGGQS